MGPGSPSAGNGGVWGWGRTRSASRGEFGLYGIANKEKRRGGKKKINELSEIIPKTTLKY